MAEAEHHAHQAPVQSAGGPQIALGIASEHQRDRYQQEHINWDEDDEHPVPFDADPIVLQRDAEIGPEQHPAVSVPGRHQRQIFLEREEADQPEKHQCGGAAEGQGQRAQRYDDPPAPHPLPQFAIRRRRDPPHHQGGQQQQTPYPTQNCENGR